MPISGRDRKHTHLLILVLWLCWRPTRLSLWIWIALNSRNWTSEHLKGYGHQNRLFHKLFTDILLVYIVNISSLYASQFIVIFQWAQDFLYSSGPGLLYVTHTVLLTALHRCAQVQLPPRPVLFITLLSLTAAEKWEFDGQFDLIYQYFYWSLAHCTHMHTHASPADKSKMLGIISRRQTPALICDRWCEASIIIIKPHLGMTELSLKHDWVGLTFELFQNIIIMKIF